MPIQQMFLRSYGSAVDPGYAINFDGSDNLSLSSTADLNPENGVFTLEFWLKPATWNDNSFNTVWHNYAVNGLYLGKDNSENFVVRSSNNTSYINATELPPIGKWTHVAAVRDGSTLYLFYNGALQESVSNSFNFATAATFISSTGGPGEYYTGRISNLRFVKGTALYTSAFTPPSSPLTSVTNTKLLCCNLDQTTSATTTPGTISAGGDPAVETGPFPFDVTGKYSVGFDGSGDYLSIPVNNSDFDWAADGSLTIEAFVNMDAINNQSYNSIINRWGGSGTYSFGLDIKNNGNLFFYRGNGSSITTHESSGASIGVGTWYHIVVVKDGTTGRFFINGTARGTFSWNEAFTNSTSIPLNIGNLSDGNSYPINGRVSNARITNGQALYTSNFTPSTTPLTTTSQSATASNVKLLCCNTNTPTGSTVTPATITANGDAVATADCPFS